VKQEKTPSCQVYFETDSFYDFSSNTGGDQLTLYSMLFDVDMKQTLADLFGERFADRVRKDLPVVQATVDNTLGMTQAESVEYDQLCERMSADEALKVIKRKRMEINSVIFEGLQHFCNLTQNYLSRAAHAYLHGRGFDEALIARFRMFTVDDYAGATRYLHESFSNDDLVKSGLFSEKGKLIFYKHRLIIPYLFNNRIVYLRGRYFDQDGNSSPEGGMKYLGLKNDALNVNSSKRLYNYDVMSRMIPGEKLYITEGEYDTMAISSMGFNAVAVPGAGNIPPVRFFKEMAKYDVVLVMDQDEAGKRLQDRLLEEFARVGNYPKLKKLNAKDVNDWMVQK